MHRHKLGLLGSAGLGALGAGLGAGLMFLLDPKAGRRRRALARDKAVHTLRQGAKVARKTSKDLGKRTRGLMAQASKLHWEDLALLGNGRGVPRSLRRNLTGVGASLGAISLGLLARGLTSPQR